MKFISSRRAYEFRMDDLRLTLLSLPIVQEQIRKLFNFAGAEIGTPLATFGPVPPTLPPGVVFITGAWVSPDKQIVPIRMLNFEPRRIVIDVAGPSSAIDPIFALLRQSLQSLASPDGSPAIGEPERTRDFSEISLPLGFDLGLTIAPEARQIMTQATLAAAVEPDMVAVPIVTFQLQRAGDEFPGLSPMNGGTLQLALRAGTRVADQLYYSAAPLPSEAHQAYLVAIRRAFGVADEALPSPPSPPKQITERASRRKQPRE